MTLYLDGELLGTKHEMAEESKGSANVSEIHCDNKN